MDEFNAMIYCMSAKMNLNNLSEDYKNNIISVGEQWKCAYASCSFEELCGHVVDFARESVLDMKWEEYDVDGVAWFIGIFTKVVLQSGLSNDFDKVFKRSIIKYFDKQ